MEASEAKKLGVDRGARLDSLPALDDDDAADWSAALEEPLMFTVGALFVRAMLEKMITAGASCRIDVHGGVDERPPWPMQCGDAHDVEVAVEALRQVAVPGYRGYPYPVLAWIVPNDREFSANELITSFLDEKDSGSLWSAIMNEGVMFISIAPTYCDLSVDCARFADASECVKRALHAAALEAEWLY